MNLLTCENLDFSYGREKILRQVSFSLKSGEILSVTGENGAGKTTLIKVLLGFLKADSGSITWSVQNKKIGYLPQYKKLKHNFPATVNEIILSGCVNSLKGPFFSSKHRIKAEENMNWLGIGDLGNRSFKQLSGGQQQKVLLARALCASQQLLVLDEPVTGLDPVATQEIYELIKQINRELGMSVLMVSHDIEGSIRYSDRILQLSYHKKRGSVSFLGPAGEYSGLVVGGDVCDRF